MTPNAVPRTAGTDAGDAAGSAVSRSRRSEVLRAAGMDAGDAVTRSRCSEVPPAA